MIFPQTQNLIVWFQCQHCGGPFPTVTEFLDHKQQWHLTEFQKINSNCIIFEEATVNQTQKPLDETPNSSGSQTKIQSGPEPEPEPVPGMELVAPLATASPPILTAALNTASEATGIERTHDQSQPFPQVTNPRVVITRLTIKEIHAASKNSKSSSKGPKSNHSSYLLLIKRKIKLTKSKSFQCLKAGCFKIFKTLRSRRMHLADADLATQGEPTPTESPTYECELCHRTFSCSSSLKKHCLEVHQQVRPFHCVHSGCGKSFKRIDGLKDHLETHAAISDRPTFPCKICSKTCLWQKSLNQHYREVHGHGTDLPFKCPEPGCTKSFKRKEGARDHVETHVDPSVRPIFACKICNCPFMRRRTLRNHSLRVHGTQM